MTITIDKTVAHSLKNIKYFLSEYYKKKSLLNISFVFHIWYNMSHPQLEIEESFVLVFPPNCNTFTFQSHPTSSPPPTPVLNLLNHKKVLPFHQCI